MQPTATTPLPSLLCRHVCGYPGTQHGGLTAAIVDETFGGLSINLWKSGLLGPRLPPLTAHLAINYKKVLGEGMTKGSVGWAVGWIGFGCGTVHFVQPKAACVGCGGGG